MSKENTDKPKKELSITKSSQKFLRKYLKKNLPLSYKFHKYSYFKTVAKAAKKMAKEIELSKEETEVLLLANWFRYGGMATNYAQYHDESAKLATDFLNSKEYPADKIQQVNELILGTKENSTAKGKMMDIMRDAAVVYTGEKDFSSMSTLLRVELEEVHQKLIKNKEWEQRQYDRLVDVSFFTSYANEKYQHGLAENIEKQRKKIAKAKTASVRKKTGKDFGRGIDTLYRTSYRNHINLSSIADGKANMMISVNTIIISAIVTLMGASLTMSNTFSFEHFRFLIPIVILLVFVLASAVYAIISARPKVTNRSITTEDIVQRKKSILFFGNFISLEKDEFIENLDMLKRNQSLLYDNMSIDMYYLGHVLDRKYRLIKYSYNIFMAGLILSVVAFLFVLIYSQASGIG